MHVNNSIVLMKIGQRKEGSGGILLNNSRYSRKIRNFFEKGIN